MTVTLSATFDTRREAEMTIERLVQQFDLDRAAIAVSAAGNENSVGEEQAGSDTRSDEPTPESRDDAPLNGAIAVSVALADADSASEVRAAFAEFHADDVEEDDQPLDNSSHA
ncbi:hypothetical protein [Sphingomonas radiodurans]|uniref:hypothetical protein n=1 Tax=Sphingomonas radiodurans TaxID=2890321 RepID=UPI001E5ABE8C|nr:hypothetical protein [Sphingomonas radiodurans]WBH15059.1 hypothetical protein LLW23_09265 [Sphingomonas radiodurans]